MNEIYAYHIFAERRKNPSRDKVILLAFAMNLSVKETQRLLIFQAMKNFTQKILGTV